MDKKLLAKLHPLERIVLPALRTERDLSGIVKKSKLQEIEVMRALQWLENKGLLKINITTKNIINLDKNGSLYQQQGLPERIFLSILDDQWKGLNVITKKTKLSREEVNACIGVLKKKLAIETEKGEFLQVKITSQGKNLLSKPSLEEEFLKKSFPLDADKLLDTEKYAVEELKKRKEIIKFEELKHTEVELTPEGQELAE